MSRRRIRVRSRIITSESGGALDFWEDHRVSLTEKGMAWAIPSSASINRVTVAAAGGNWPSGLTHVAENVYFPEQGAAYESVNLWRDLSVGEYLFIRMLLKNSLPNPTGSGTGGDHGFQTNFSAPLPWFWRIYDFATNGGGSTDFGIDFSSWDQSGVNEMRLDAPKNTVLRFEWRAERTGTSSAILAARVTNNQTETLLQQKTGITQSAAAGGGANPFREFKFGMSGQGGADYTGGSVYWGGVAARISANANDWIGAYPVGPEA